MLVSAVLAAFLGAAQAQVDYPGKPVRIICDSAPGSATDVTARIVADGLSRLWGQQVVVLNHPGGGGSIAARVAATSPNDGYTIYLAAASTFTALAGAPGVADNLPLQLPRDFLPIGFVSQQPMVIAVSPALGVATVPELIPTRQGEARGNLLRHHRARPHHASDHGAVPDARRREAADDSL